MYTPVPVVAAGDWIDEVFINTYWVDNMAAGIPDLFTAKGQLAVGLGVDSMGILSVGSNGTSLVADSSETLGVKWDTRTKFTFFSSFVSLTGLSTAIGNQTIAATDISGVPESAIALMLNFSVLWADVSLSPMVLVTRTSGHNAISIYGQVNNKTITGSGIVPLSSGTFVVRVLLAAVSSIGAQCIGYIE